MIRELLNDKAVAGRRRLFFLYGGRRLICNTAVAPDLQYSGDV